MDWENIYSEFKRRKVIKAAISYVAVSWLILQAASIILPALNAPDRAMHYTLMVLIFCFPVWIIIAWIYDFTSKGIKKTESNESFEEIEKKYNNIIILTLSLVVLILIVDRVFNLSSKVIGSDEENSIAVLSFNIDSDSVKDFYSDGIADDILTQLTKISGLRVLSRFTLSGFESSGKSIKKIGEELGVSYVITGKIRTQEDAIRVSCQLVNTRTGVEIWAEDYDRSLDEVFEIQSIIATSVAEELNLQLQEDEKSRIKKLPTQNLKAYSYYSRGRDELNKESGESNELAISYFERALKEDDLLAEGWSGLAMAKYLGVKSYQNAPQNTLDSSLIWAKKGVELNDEIAETWYVLGRIQASNFNYLDAEESFLKAIEKSPNHYPSIFHLSIIMTQVGKLVEAESLLRKSIKLYPVNDGLYSMLGNVYRRLGFHEEAIEFFYKAIDLNPGINRDNYFNLAFAAIMMKEYSIADGAIKNYISDSPASLAMAAYFYLFFDKEKARELINKSIQHPKYDPEVFRIATLLHGYFLRVDGNQIESDKILNARYQYHLGRISKGEEEMMDLVLLADISCVLKDSEACLDWLERAIKAGETDFEWYEQDPLYEIVRNEERFKSLMGDLKIEISKMHQQVLINNEKLKG